MMLSVAWLNDFWITKMLPRINDAKWVSVGIACDSRLLMPAPVRYIDCGKMYNVSQAYFEMVWNRWVATYLPKWNVRHDWPNLEEYVLNVADQGRLVDKSIRRHENQMARLIEVFTGADSVIRSTAIKMCIEAFSKTRKKLIPGS